MKKGLIIFLSIILISSIYWEYGYKPKKIENKVSKQILEGKVKDKHMKVLESTKTYEEMTSNERTAAIEITEGYWSELSKEQQEKYLTRKEFILKTRYEAVDKWKSEPKNSKSSNIIVNDEMNGSGSEKIGEYGIAYYDENISDENLVEFFYNDVKKRNLNYVTLINKKNKREGYVFSGTSGVFNFGEVDKNGLLQKSIRSGVIEGNKIKYFEN
ncbi:hypothetical protein JJB67_05995 [Clostridium perfringens]|uniref:hypothetical protein n=1 Tax=Clostridium perfringens TaxID=1502 RepID=UPI000D7162DA|nr:hypothetical protein [Clostridium perfringens]MBO3321997.1 hypothetical protein [Clostridium perfringens]MBO3331060.1 hypothetical protein [Clostridium perfringens]PWW95173.1 hypothetical protein CYK76_13675 [Clostridium perfringens]PWX04572.1 hypothetical protein CYK73_00890 [Clostridium perfringens]PWX72334.1 hypothetical protein CYK77_08800 [Clostridium perfringens]